jgi:ring-1,2-phenylacetyl-CoA epoxidase subunit PaaA
MMMFGPNDADSPNSEYSMKTKIKRFSNDELRQRFMDATKPQADILGLTIPDPDLKWNEVTGHWDYGEINWEEFNNVVQGNGPCNKLRVKARKEAWDNGKWVREAATAYAAKREQRKSETKQVA